MIEKEGKPTVAQGEKFSNGTRRKDTLNCPTLKISKK